MIDRNSSLPLYLQVKQLILDAVKSGEYSPGSKIPAETELTEIFGVSRPTVRQAVSELVNEGILQIERGRGTFVCNQSQQLTLEDFSFFSFSLLSTNRIMDLAMLSSEEAERLPPFLLEAYGIDPANQEAQNFASSFYRFHWLTGTDDFPYAVTETYIPAAMFPGLPQQIREGRSMLDITANKYALLPVRSRNYLFSGEADVVDAMELNCSPTASIFVLQSVFTSRSGDICEVSETKVRSDSIRLSFMEDHSSIRR